MYPGDRHEILNEENHEKVYEDIFNWLCEHNALTLLDAFAKMTDENGEEE